MGHLVTGIVMSGFLWFVLESWLLPLCFSETVEARYRRGNRIIKVTKVLPKEWKYRLLFYPLAMGMFIVVGLADRSLISSVKWANAFLAMLWCFDIFYRKQNHDTNWGIFVFATVFLVFLVNEMVKFTGAGLNVLGIGITILLGLSAVLTLSGIYGFFLFPDGSAK